MTHIQLLQQCFPIEVVQKIMLFQSHPIADIMRDCIVSFKTQEAEWIDYWEFHLKYIDKNTNYYFKQWYFSRRDENGSNHVKW